MNPPANWYPDPTGRHGQRYWDGSQWTEHVFTDGVQDVDPLDAATPEDAAAETADEERDVATAEDPATDLDDDSFDVATATDDTADVDDTDRLLEEAAAAAAEAEAVGTDAAGETATDADGDGGMADVADDDGDVVPDDVADDDWPVAATPAADPSGDDEPAADTMTGDLGQDAATDEPAAAAVTDDLDDSTAPAAWADRDANDELDDEPAATPEGSGLFADASPADPDSSHAPDGTAWRPDDGTTADDGPAQDEEVAPEVEAEDVVAAVDEATDARDVADFSDAFVLAPETASRLVGGGDQTAGQEATDAGDDTPDDAMPPPATADRGPVDDPAATTAPAAAEESAGDDVAPADDAAPAPATSDLAATPPAQAPSELTIASLGMRGDLVSGAFAEQEDVGPVALQNSRLLRCSAAGGIVARQGTMVAYQGDVDFERQGAGGVGRAFKRAATGEGMAMMRVTGSGDVFFADGGQHVFLLQLEGGPGLSVNGRNVLAFSSSLQWDIERVKGATLLAGGLFNTTLQGSGWVALVSDGQPVVLRTDGAPTFVDVNALVAWSGGLSTSIVNTVGAKSLIGLGSGEAFQMAFEGAGIVVVQPSEGASAAGG